MMVMEAKVAICPMTMSANTDHVTFSGIVPILSEVTFVRVGKDIPGMGILVQISTSVPTPPWPQNV